jgi:hypothetical protein
MDEEGNRINNSLLIRSRESGAPQTPWNHNNPKNNQQTRAPTTHMDAIRNALTPIREATDIATGASSAVAAMFPAPIVESAAASKKNIRGIAPTLPRATFTDPEFPYLYRAVSAARSAADKPENFGMSARD